MTAGTGNQVEALAEKLPVERGEDLTSPRMPFRSAYLLTRGQEDALIDHAVKRLEQLEGQMGRQGEATVSEEGGTRGSFDTKKFFGKREQYTARYYNHVGDRAEAGTIYEHSNVTASLSQRVAAQGVARANAFFFGQPDDDAWFFSDPVGIDDSDLAETIKKHARWKINQCKVKSALEQSVEFAFVRGEAVVKITHQNRGQIYKRRATILVDEAGEPILDAHEDYIIEGDAFIPEMDVAEVPGGMVDPQTGEPVMETVEVETGRQVLKRDGVTVLPETPIWVEQIITRRLVTFEGPEVKLVYYKDFLCSEAATDIQTADFIAHLYDLTFMQVAELFQGSFGEGEEAIANIEEAVRRLREMTSYGAQPKAAEGQPREDFAETDTAQSPNNPSGEFAECWLTYDADGDGIQEEIMLILDRRAKAPVFYEYAANVTVRGKRPFAVIRPKAIDGRWWGMGLMEYLEPEQTFIDLELNRKNFADGGAGRVTFWRPYNTEEGARDPNLKLHHGGTYTPLPGKKDEDVLSYVTLPHEGEHFMELLQLFMQMAQLKSGLINAGDQQMSGLPSSELATGINEVRDSGQELFTSFLSALFPGVSEALASAIEVIYANVNRKEVFGYFNGPDAAQATSILTLTPDDVRDLTLNISLVLSRSQERRVLETGAQADALIDKFYMRPMLLQVRTAEFARRQLKALRVAQAEKIIEPTDLMAAGVMPPDVPGTLPAGAPPAAVSAV